LFESLDTDIYVARKNVQCYCKCWGLWLVNLSFSLFFQLTKLWIKHCFI